MERRTLFAWLIAASMTAIWSGGQALAATELRFAHGQPPESITNKAALFFKEKVEEGTKGEVLVKVYPAGQLGSNAKQVEGVRLGTIDITTNGNPFFTSFAPRMNVIDLPYLFDNLKQAYSVLDGDIGQSLLADLEKHGIKGLAFWELGFRHVTNSKRPIRTPEDLKGLKIRTTPNKAHLKAFELWGANPVPMSFNEVYMAMQTKTIDGEENPIWTIHDSRFNEVQQYMTLTHHAYTAQVMVMNLRKFQSLTADQQKVIMTAAVAATQFQRKGLADEQGKKLAALKAAGMQVIEDVDTKPFKNIVYEPLKAEYVKQFGPDVLDAILAKTK